MEIFLKTNWPLVLIATWFIYKWWSAKKVKGMLPGLKKNGALLLDVRSTSEYQSGHAPDTINIPLNELSERLNEIPKTSPVIVGCASGTRSGMARMLLKRNGYKNVYNVGAWRNFMA